MEFFPRYISLLASTSLCGVLVAFARQQVKKLQRWANPKER
jgi:hypothetical protein